MTKDAANQSGHAVAATSEAQPAKAPSQKVDTAIQTGSISTSATHTDTTNHHVSRLKNQSDDFDAETDSTASNITQQHIIKAITELQASEGSSESLLKGDAREGEWEVIATEAGDRDGDRGTEKEGVERKEEKQWGSWLIWGSRGRG